MKDGETKASSECESLFYKDGEVIFEEGSSGKEIYIIESGKVEISRHIARVKTTLAVLEKGAFFGEMASITDNPRSATATAIGDVRLKSLAMESLIQRMETDPEFMVMVLKRLINRLRNTTAKLGTLDFRIYSLGENSVEGSFPAFSESLQEVIHDLRTKLKEKERLLEYYRSPWWRRWFGKGQKKEIR